MNETVSIAGEEFISEILKASEEVPLLPLKDTVIFPHTIVPLYVGREKSLRAIERAAAGDKVLLLATQREQVDDEPALENSMI
jgi:ATP-dependent Lon protease